MTSDMANPKAVSIDRTPNYNDLDIANLVHRALAAVQEAGRCGDRKVFIASLWAMMLHIEAQTGGTVTRGASIEHFKAWLLRGLRLTRDGTEKGAPLVVLARADFVAAMDPTMVAASETLTDGASFHFVLDPAGACSEYAPWTPSVQAVRSHHARARRSVATNTLRNRPRDAPRDHGRRTQPRRERSGERQQRR
jgi:hypothetical protein